MVNFYSNTNLRHVEGFENCVIFLILMESCVVQREILNPNFKKSFERQGVLARRKGALVFVWYRRRNSKKKRIVSFMFLFEIVRR